MTASCYQNGEYLARHPRWHEEDASWKSAQVCRMLERNRMTPSTFCEVGCGAGGVLADLQRRQGPSARFWGYEVSPQAYEICRSKENERLRFVLGDVIEEPPTRTYDVVMLLDVVEHIEDHMEFLRRVRPLGRAKIFHFPLDLSVQSLLRGVPSRVRETAGHIHYFTRELALMTLRDTGYEVVDYFYTPAALETGTPGLGTRLLKLPRKLMFSINPNGAALCLGGFSLLILAV